mgnify:CR=1 FL=1
MMISLKHLNRRAGAVLVSLLLLLTLAVSASAAAVKMSVGVRFWRESGDKESMADSSVDTTREATLTRQPNGTFTLELPVKQLSSMNMTGRLTGIAIGEVNYDGTLSGDLSDGTAVTLKIEDDSTVVGGGDTGNDCVGTAIRQGCKHVIQFEMMGKPPIERLPSNPWPQWPDVLKTDYGQEEAIYLQGEDPRIYNTTVEEFLKDDQGNLTGVTAVNLSWAGGKMTKLDTYPVDVDMVLIAAGFLGCQSYVADAFGVTQTPRTCVATESGTHKTSVPKVFTAGDMRRGQSLVVWGIREGREVAREVDTFLMGYSNLETVE